jgi:hypothetical protein
MLFVYCIPYRVPWTPLTLIYVICRNVEIIGEKKFNGEKKFAKGNEESI